MSCVHGGGGGPGGAGGGNGDGGGSGGDGGRGQPSSATHSMQSCSPHVMSVHHGEQRLMCCVASLNRPQPCCMPQRAHAFSLHVHFEHQSSHDAWPSGSRMDATHSIGRLCCAWRTASLSGPASELIRAHAEAELSL